MVCIKNIEITEKLLHHIECDWLDYGAESYIYKQDKNSIYKIFRTERKDVLENKLAKITMLNKLGIDFLTNPVATISCNGEFVGYKMNYDQDDMTWFNTYLTLEDRKNYLKLVKDKLLILEQFGILYSDIKEDNLLINRKTGKLKFCDIDNVQIEGLKVDMVRVIAKHLKGRDELFNNSIHAFMHNIYTLHQLERLFINDIKSLIELKDEKFCSSFNDNQKKIIKNMSLLRKNNISDEYLIDNLN